MIATPIPCADVGEALRYLLLERDCELVCGSNQAIGNLLFPHSSPEGIRGIAEALSSPLRVRSRVPRPFRHMAIAVPPGERLDQNWKTVAMEFLAANGVVPAKHEFLVVRHLDRPHDHIHVIWCRIGSDGSLIRDRLGDGAIAQQVCRKMEEHFGLRRLTSSIEGFPPSVTSSGERKRKRPSRAVYEMRKRGVVPEVDHFCNRLDAAWPSEGEVLPFRALMERWERDGIQLEVTKKGPRVGLLYIIDGKRKKASDLGDQYKWTSLSKHISAEITAEDIRAVRSIRPPEKKSPFALNPEQAAVVDAAPKAILNAIETQKAAGSHARPLPPKAAVIPDLLSLMEDAYARFSKSTQEERRIRISASPHPGPRSSQAPSPWSDRAHRKPGRR